MACFRSERHDRTTRRESSGSGRLLFFFILLASMSLLSGCEFFSTSQERRGVNPKPFNSQPSWETNPYQHIRN